MLILKETISYQASYLNYLQVTEAEAEAEAEAGEHVRIEMPHHPSRWMLIPRLLHRSRCSL
jgi:hypothetical protein